MRDKFKILKRPCDGKYTLKRKSIFGWWRFVGDDGEPYHYEFISHGNTYDTYDSFSEAQKTIDDILKSEQEEKKLAKNKHLWLEEK